MSGVEAIFGIVTGAAGLISLGIELGESAAKLRRLYHAVRDAPKTIAGLAFDLETMAMALSELEKIRQRDTSSSAILSRCITRCQHSTAEIRQVVDKMECCIAKHSRIRGRLYTAFKERDVRDLLNDLEKARTSLHLAYTMYHSEQQMQRHHEHGNMLSFQGRKSDDIMRQLTLLVHSFTPPPQQQQHQLDTADNQYAETWLRATKDNQHLDRTEINLPLKRSYKENDTTHKRFQLRLPVWFCRRVWDLTISSAHCGWSMQLRTYNVIHQNSLIFGYCYAGDVVGAQRLLQSGGASPLDVYEEYPGRFETLIEVGVVESRQWNRSNILGCCKLWSTCNLSISAWPDNLAAPSIEQRSHVLRLPNACGS